MTPVQSRLESIRLGILNLAPIVEAASLIILGAVILLALFFPSIASAAPVGIEKSFAIQAGGVLEVESEGASVSISTHEGAGARVAVSRGTDDEDEIREDYRVDITQTGNVLRVELERLRPWRLFSWGRGPEIEIDLPRRFDVDAVATGGAISVEDLDGKIQARTSGGSVSLASISGEVSATTSGGSIRLESSGGDADLRTSGGSIVIGDVSGTVNARTSGGSIVIDRAEGPVKANTSGGSIEIEEVRGPILAETSGGSVRAYLSEPPGSDSSLRTSGGGITVYLASGVGVNVDARAQRVTSEFEVAGGDGSYQDDDTLVGPINGGGPALTLRTSGGGIRLMRR